MRAVKTITTTELLDLAKAKTGSDSATARFIEVYQQYIPDMRKGKRHLTTAHILHLSDLCGLDWVEVIASLELEKETRPKVRELWRKKSEPLGQQL